jgi:hypothetical protein
MQMVRGLHRSVSSVAVESKLLAIRLLPVVVVVPVVDLP